MHHVSILSIQRTRIQMFHSSNFFIGNILHLVLDGMSPLLHGRQMPRMSLFKRLPNQGTPTNVPAKRLSPVRSNIKVLLQ